MIALIRANNRTLMPVVAVVLLAVLGGALMAARLSYAPLALGGAAAALLALRWRAGVIVLLCALPFAGVPAFLAGEPGLAARDLCIVAPLYAAFALEMTRTHHRIVPTMGVALPALAIFAALVMAQALRSPNVLAGAIGTRVWLAYIPMLAVGYRFVRAPSNFETMVKLTALLGLVPAVLACVECAYAVGRGDFGPFEGIYGAWQLTETQRFVVFTTGDGHLRIPRVPATFTGVTQYFGFSLVAFAAALAMAFRRGGAWRLCAIVLGVGALASGARAAYVALPAIALTALVLSGRLPRRPNVVLLAVAAYLLFALVIGSAIAGIAQELPSHALVSLRTATRELWSGFSLFGQGTGWDTNAALRYGGVDERRYIENWYAKAMLELGIGGLVAIVVAFASMAWGMLNGLRSMDGDARMLAAPVCGLLMVTTVLLFKGPYVDLDPLNVYFWLLLGALFGLYESATSQGGAR